MATENGANGFVANAGEDLPNCDRCGFGAASNGNGAAPTSRFVAPFELLPIALATEPVGFTPPAVNVGVEGMTDVPTDLGGTRPVTGPITAAGTATDLGGTQPTTGPITTAGGGGGGGGGDVMTALAGDVGGIPVIVWIAVIGLVLLRGK